MVTQLSLACYNAIFSSMVRNTHYSWRFTGLWCVTLVQIMRKWWTQMQPLKADFSAVQWFNNIQEQQGLMDAEAYKGQNQKSSPSRQTHPKSQIEPGGVPQIHKDWQPMTRSLKYTSEGRLIRHRWKLMRGITKSWKRTKTGSSKENMIHEGKPSQ